MFFFLRFLRAKLEPCVFLQGHAACAERFDDDPFLPDFTDTLLGEARGACVKPSSEATKIDIVDRNGDVVRQIRLPFHRVNADDLHAIFVLKQIHSFG